MNIDECVKAVREYTKARGVLEAMEAVQAELRECPDTVPWNVRHAYNTIYTGMRAMFFGEEK
jgi:hypothetical protein